MIGVDEAHPVLQELRAEYGANVAALVVEKKKEVGLVCGSPHRCLEQMSWEAGWLSEGKHEPDGPLGQSHHCYRWSATAPRGTTPRRCSSTRGANYGCPRFVGLYWCRVGRRRVGVVLYLLVQIHTYIPYILTHIPPPNHPPFLPIY